MINEKELSSLVSLLDDNDEEVFSHVETKLLSMGRGVIPFLENEWDSSANLLLQDRIEDVIHKIQFHTVKSELEQWAAGGGLDLFHGVYLISRFRYPDLDKQKLSNELDKIKLEVWLEMNYDLTPLEKVRILNHALYKTFGFQGNTTDYHAPQNSFLNTVLDTRKGNPISLAIVYCLVAQRLNIPVFGVNLPQHFVLAYLDDTEHDYKSLAFNADWDQELQGRKVLFYVNAFNNGAVFSRKNVEQFLKQIDIEARPEYFMPCSNLELIKRVLRNLIYAYEKANDGFRSDEVKELLAILGEDPSDTSGIINDNPEEEG